MMSCIFHLKLKNLTILFMAFIFIHNVHVIKSRKLPADKRTLVAAGGNEIPGQLEEVFDVGNQIDFNYDEYPMVVPKRAALGLDRLMVALHRALEKARVDQRNFDDFYRNNSIENKIGNSDQESLQYSGDDPSVLMDYDFKDLNSINRATGETLMAKGFQRRASLGSNRPAAPAATKEWSGGRKYWRCYFNAVTCF